MSLENETRPTGLRALPRMSKGILTDVRFFFLRKPAVPTLIRFGSEAEREKYAQRIIQRLGIGVTQYAILNIHRIGIEAPVRFVFEEFLKWGGDSTFWPNHIARATRVDGRLEHIQIYLLGRNRSLFGLKNGFLGLKFIPLFDLNAQNFQQVPSPSESDNARYLLYRCSGGYPIGIFSIYVRSPIAGQGEVDETQVFFIVGFNFYGKKDWPHARIVNPVWEMIHNRVTNNVLNRFKHLCEAKFQSVVAGDYSNIDMTRPGFSVPGSLDELPAR